MNTQTWEQFLPWHQYCSWYWFTTEQRRLLELAQQEQTARQR